MSEARLHHFVPRFHLSRFADSSGRIWVWDKTTRRVFSTGARAIAAETDFYFHDDLAAAGHDPLTLEKQFSSLEGEASRITGAILKAVATGVAGDSVGIAASDRETFSLFLATQYLRTADARDILSAFGTLGPNEPSESRLLHLHLLWDEPTVDLLTSHFRNYSWTFAQNRTATPWVTSDNPLAFKTGDNRKWIKLGILAPDVYLTYAIAPDCALYGYPREGRFAAIAKFDGTISPVEMTDGMVRVDNTAHVFLATRHVVSPTEHFGWADQFQHEIADGTHAPH